MNDLQKENTRLAACLKDVVEELNYVEKEIEGKSERIEQLMGERTLWQSKVDAYANCLGESIAYIIELESDYFTSENALPQSRNGIDEALTTLLAVDGRSEPFCREFRDKRLFRRDVEDSTMLESGHLNKSGRLNETSSYATNNELGKLIQLKSDENESLRQKVIDLEAKLATIDPHNTHKGLTEKTGLEEQLTALLEKRTIQMREADQRAINLEDVNSQLKHANDIMEAEIEELKCDLLFMKEQVAVGEANEKLWKENKALTAEVEGLKAELHRVEALHGIQSKQSFHEQSVTKSSQGEVSVSHVALGQQLVTVQSVCSQLTDSLARCKTRLAESNQHKADMQRAITLSQEAISARQLQLSQLAESGQSDQSQRSEISDKLQKLRDLSSQCAEKIQNISEKRQTLIMALQRHQQGQPQEDGQLLPERTVDEMYRSIDSMAEQKQTLAEEIQHLLDQRQSLTAQLGSFAPDTANGDEQRQRLQEELVTLQEKITNAKSQIEQEDLSIRSIHEEMQKLESELGQKRAQVRSLESKLPRKSTSSTDLSRSASIQSAIGQSQGSNVDASFSIQDEKEVEKDVLASSQFLLTIAEDQQKKLAGELELLRGQLAAEKQSNQMLFKENSEFNERISHLTHAKTQNDELTTLVSKLEADLVSYRTDNAELMQKTSQMEEDIKKKVATLEALQKDSDRLQSALSRASHMEKENHALTNELAAARAKLEIETEELNKQEKVRDMVHVGWDRTIH